MGILCEQDESWQDALSFYGQTQQADADAALIALAVEQIVRVREIARLESTAPGKRQRQFDKQLLVAVSKMKDPVVGLDEAVRIVPRFRLQNASQGRPLRRGSPPGVGFPGIRE